MNKEITVIDLFKRIEKHEDIPKKIKYKDSCYMFKHTNYSIDHLYVLIGHESIGWLEHKDINLFDEVEILEDNTEEQEKLGESWKEVGKRVGEWAKEFEQGFKESFTEIINYPFKNLEDNTEEIEELSYEWTTNEIADRVDKLIKAVNQIRKDLNKC